MIRKLFIILLSAAYLGLALGGAAPVVYCTADLEVCPAGVADTCCAGESKTCCSHKESDEPGKSRPGCCVAITETGEGWVLPASVKAPDFTPFECYSLPGLVLVVPACSAERVTRANDPDPPGPAGRALLVRVSRQLV